jgi:hypothetical protein
MFQRLDDQASIGRAPLGGSLPAGGYNVTRGRNGQITSARRFAGFSNRSVPPSSSAGEPLLTDSDGNGIPDLTDRRREEIREILNPDQIMDDENFRRAQAAISALGSLGVPYTDEVINGLAGQASDQTAAAANAQRELLSEQMARTGGNINDPSYMAANRAIDADRMGQNNVNRRDIAIQAALANYGARADNLATQADLSRGLGLAQQGLANDSRRQLADTINNWSDEPYSNQSDVGTPQRTPTYTPPRRPSPSSTAGTASSSGTSLGGGGASNVGNGAITRSRVGQAGSTSQNRIGGPPSPYLPDNHPSLTGLQRGSTDWRRARGEYDRSNQRAGNPPLAGPGTTGSSIGQARMSGDNDGSMGSTGSRRTRFRNPRIN